MGTLLSTNSWDVFARSFGGMVPRKRRVPRQHLHLRRPVWSEDRHAGREPIGCLDQSGPGRFPGRGLCSTPCEWSPERFGFRVNTDYRQQTNSSSGCVGRRETGFWRSGPVTSAPSGFDLFAQRYAAGQPLPAPAAPWVSALSQSRLMVTWAPLSGLSPNTKSIWMARSPSEPHRRHGQQLVDGDRLAPSSTHSFRLAYLFAGGQRSPLSPAASGKTWGEDLNGDGLPDDWEPSIGEPNNPIGSRAGRIAMAMGLPTTRNSWPARTRRIEQRVATSHHRHQQGRWLNWTTQPGFIYQVQTSADARTWVNFGAPRLARGQRIR